MKPPIVINESRALDEPGDLSIWPNPKAAEEYVEPIDVQNQEFFVFDSEGKLLRFETDGERCWLVEAEPTPTHQAVLRKILQDLFRYFQAEETWVQSASLDDLVNEGVKKFRYY